MLKEIIKRALMGFMIGVFVGETILIFESLIGGNGSFYPVSAYLSAHTRTEIGAVIFQYIITGILGLTFSTGSIIFELDSWSLLKQTVVHFVVSSVIMYLAGFFCGWFPHTVGSTLVWFGVFVVVYLIFWVCFSLYYKNKVKKINDAL